jgi:hypothetical protein
MKKSYSLTIVTFIGLLSLLLTAAPTTLAQAPGERDLTFKALGYQDTVLHAPNSGTSYYFGLPLDWEIVDGSYIALDIDYSVEVLGDSSYKPIASLEVRFNDQSVQVETLLVPSTRQLQVTLPAQQFRQLLEEERPNKIEVLLQAEIDCTINVRSSVKIKDTSRLHLAYQERPLPFDLAFYPRPLYQSWAFEPSQTRFVLPADANAADMQAATIVAARLGQLTYNQAHISATLVSKQSTLTVPEEHLIVIGKPDNNPVIGQLSLPIPLVERKLVLRSEMPAAVAPASVFSYTLAVENTSPQTQSLAVEDRFSPYSQLIDCGSACQQVAPGQIRWNVGSLAAQQQVSTTVTLQLTPAISDSTFMRHTATLLDQQGHVLNADTLSAQIADKADERRVTSPVQRSTSIFVQEGQAVAEDAGVLQELVSPWNPQRAVVVVAGVTDEGLLKAAYGLNPENRFPGIWGPSAIIADMRPLSSTIAAPRADMTFAALGYADEELIVIDGDSRGYAFQFPPGTTLGDNSYLSLHITHSPVITAGMIKVSLNGITVGSATLDASNVNNTWLRVPLNGTAIRPGNNTLRIEPTASVADLCVARKDYWLMLYADSFLHFAYQPARTEFSLASFPYPFTRSGDLEDVIFALPDAPTQGEVEGLLRIASLFGSGSGGKELAPRTIIGQGPGVAALKNSHIVAIGLPTQNSLIRAANEHLPQPFLPDSNNIDQRVDHPNYALAPGTDLGYVQELVSPWGGGENLALVIATGTTDTGVNWALSALTQFYDQLSGDLVLARGNKLYTADTRAAAAQEVFTNTTALTPTVTAAAAPTPTPSPASAQTPTPTAVSQAEARAEAPTLAPAPTKAYAIPEVIGTRPWWLLALLVISLLAIAVLIIVVIRREA